MVFRHRHFTAASSIPDDGALSSIPNNDRMCSLSVYETPTHFYIVGSDHSGNRFRTLKIDRVADREFIASESENDYSQADVGELLATVSSSSIVTPTEKWSKRRNCAGGFGLLRTVDKAWGLIGAVRFLEGYYLLIVSRAKLVTTIGFHSIFKVEDVSMVYIPAAGAPSHPDELKYANSFKSVDLTADFYFSCTYQLSRTLQENCLAEKGVNWNRNKYGRTMGAEKKFVWNEYLLEPLRKNGISRKWTLELVRGYVSHQMLELPCSKLDLIIFARRSASFAGTRFLKRGTNCDGAVANDVETEQIVWDANSPMSFCSGKFSSFVQRRGSVPLFWSQSSTHRGAPMVVGKPPIVIDRVEPHALTTAKHFRELNRKYGHPLIVLNLVKREEHRHNENLLHEIFLKTVRYLNDFRRTQHSIDYISFDVSRCNKSGRVLQRLEELGQRVVLSNGWFQSFPPLHSRSPSNLLAQSSFMPSGTEEVISRYAVELSHDGRMLLQHGIARSNCVDCLDRTNVVQFGIGKVALGWQLFSMGFLNSPWSLHLQTEVSRVFEEMFDEHGDTLAWQYAGSQLVHSIKTYKRTAVFQERSRDVLQTISRYYSNTFSDFDKQDALNLFLGIFRVPSHLDDACKPHIWTLGSDHYLHFPIVRQTSSEFLEWSISVNLDGGNERSDEEESDWLEEKGELGGWLLLKTNRGELSKLESNFDVDGNESDDLCEQNFNLFYRTFELTSLEQVIRSQHQMQFRRQLVLDALDQGPQQKDSFMRMFRANDPSSSSPPPSVASRRKGSASSNLSSLAAGTASIVVRESNNKTAEGTKINSAEEMKIETDGCDGEWSSETDGLTTANGDREMGDYVVMTRDEKRMERTATSASQQQEAAALAVAVAEEMDGGGGGIYSDLLVMEDRNGATERSKDPLAKFLALLKGPNQLGNRVQAPPEVQLNLSSGLKSPREVYFANPDVPLFSISDADLALYTHYASASALVFERHNLKRQRRPTVWKLPAPPNSARLRQKSSSIGESLLPPLRLSFGHRKEQEQQKKKKSSLPPPMQRILPPMAKSTAIQSPFRKDFSKLGPMFQFRPSLFTDDSAFNTELREVPEESIRLYREAVEMQRPMGDDGVSKNGWHSEMAVE